MSEYSLSFIDVIEKNSKKMTNPKMSIVYQVISRSGTEGATTRVVADACNMSIYSARNWLLKLESDGLVYKIVKPKNTTWHSI